MASLHALGPFAHIDGVAAGGDVSTIAHEAHLFAAVACRPPS
jgi:hypothetical protein